MLKIAVATEPVVAGLVECAEAVEACTLPPNL